MNWDASTFISKGDSDQVDIRPNEEMFCFLNSVQWKNFCIDNMKISYDLDIIRESVHAAQETDKTYASSAISLTQISIEFYIRAFANVYKN